MDIDMRNKDDGDDKGGRDYDRSSHKDALLHSFHTFSIPAIDP